MLVSCVPFRVARVVTGRIAVELVLSAVGVIVVSHGATTADAPLNWAAVDAALRPRYRSLAVSPRTCSSVEFASWTAAWRCRW